MIWVCQDQKPTLLLDCPVAHIVSETKDQLPAEADNVMAFQTTPTVGQHACLEELILFQDS